MKMSEKFCLSVTYNDGKRYERTFEKLTDIPPFIKENFLKYGIASIVFADDMSEVENTDFEAFFNDIVTENDPETMMIYAEHIKVWKETVSTTDALRSTIKIFNEIYSKELTNSPKLKMDF